MQIQIVEEKTTSDSVQLFYSRNLVGPNNYQNEEFVIPVSSTRSPQKTNNTSFNGKNIILKKDGKSPYIQADLEKLKQYINIPKSKTHKRSKSQTIKAAQQARKAVRSALKAEHLNTDETMDDSLYQLKDYNSIQNSIVWRASKKNVIMNKNSKIKRIITKKKGEKQNDRYVINNSFYLKFKLIKFDNKEFI